jgi:hypothetical protein
MCACFVGLSPALLLAIQESQVPLPQQLRYTPARIGVVDRSLNMTMAAVAAASINT